MEEFETLDDVFVYAKQKLKNDTMNILIFNSFMQKIVRVVSIIMHDHHTILEVFKLALLLNILSRKAYNFGLEVDKINNLIEIISNYSIDERNGNKSIIFLLSEVDRMKEDELIRHFIIA